MGCSTRKTDLATHLFARAMNGEWDGDPREYRILTSGGSMLRPSSSRGRSYRMVKSWAMLASGGRHRAKGGGKQRVAARRHRGEGGRALGRSEPVLPHIPRDDGPAPRGPGKIGSRYLGSPGDRCAHSSNASFEHPDQDARCISHGSRCAGDSRRAGRVTIQPGSSQEAQMTEAAS